MSRLPFWQGAYYPLMRWRRESFWGQERTGRGRKTDREVGETTMKSVRERGSDGDSDQWNAATICVRCQTALKQILLFNEKRGDEKENSSAKKKKTQMWWRRTRGRKRWAGPSNFYFLDCFLLPGRTHLCPHTLNTHNKSAVSYYRSPSRWMVVNVTCGSAGSAGLSLSVRRPHPRGLWHKRVDFSLKRPQSW